MRDTPARYSRGLDPISAMSWGRKPVRRVNKAERLFEWAAFRPSHPIKQAIKLSADAPAGWRATRSAQPADLFLGHYALDVLGLALDAVARAAVRLDRQAADDGINTALLDDGAALRALQLVVNVVIYRVIVRHRAVFPVGQGLVITP